MDSIAEEQDIRLIDAAWCGTELRFSVGVFDRVFNCRYCYQGFIFEGLTKTYGDEKVASLCFHIIAFEMAKYCSLAPKTIDFGPLAKYWTPALKSLWYEVFKNVWGQWRYENGCPDYLGPICVNSCRPLGSRGPITQLSVEHPYLVFSGGGKDSLVAMQTLDKHQVLYRCFAYTHSGYGDHSHQQQLVQQQLSVTGAQTAHTLRVDDDFVDESLDLSHSPWPHWQVTKTVLHAETPCSIFGVIPVMLAHGYGAAVLAHERSADIGNLIWDRTGEEINHQWGKSWEAGQLLNNYVRTQLLTTFEYFSVLKPLTDVLIFNLLANYADLARFTHSCNIEKPWCKRCAKCAYVWLNMKAYLPQDLVDSIFQGDLFDDEVNDVWFRQMLGLAEHTPFECVGQISEARLALHLYRENNNHPLAERLYSLCDEDWFALTERLTQPEYEHSNLPESLAGALRKFFSDEADSARKNLFQRLQKMALFPATKRVGEQ